MRPTLFAATPLVAVLFWVAALLVDPGDYASGSVILIGAGSLTLAAVGTVGLVLAGGRWSRWTLVSVMAAMLLLSVFRPTDLLALLSLAATAAALIVLLAPVGAVAVRRRPATAAPPQKAVLVMLGALSLPLVLGLVPAVPNAWVSAFAAAGPVATYLYGRTVPGGLAAVRFGLPVLAAISALLMPVPHAVVAVVAGALTTTVAWSADVAVAFRPLVRQGSSYAIPPELVPKDILETAKIDERGRPV